MPYISLYRKYRPHKFEEVVGQDVIVKILKNSILNNKINHAYIFSGPRGTGKTSIAKIFSRVINCKNPINGDICDQCDFCKNTLNNELDIIEIDAASNNGVEEIREIRNTIKLMPSMLKYKVFIIDEVHMLSNSAFNALLKTLEEPPAHAIFILATTEIDKIPSTVLSRCQKFDFKRISEKNIFDRLKYICKCENITINDEIVKTISHLSDGGMRDAINLLDQLVGLNKKTITQTDVYNLIGDIDENQILSLFDSITECDVNNVIDLINDYYESGFNFIKMITKLENIVKNIIIFSNTTNYFSKDYEKKLFKYAKIDINTLIEISKDLFDLENKLKKANNHKSIVEVYLIKLCLYFSDKEDTFFQSNKKSTESDIDFDYEIEEKIVGGKEKNVLINNVLCKADKKIKNIFIDKFSKVKDYLTDKDYNNISNLLIKSDPVVVSDEIVLFTFKNNFEVVLFDKNINEIVKFLKKLYNKKYVVVSITHDQWLIEKSKYINNISNGIKYKYIEKNQKKSNKNNKNTVLESSVENIFGDEYITED